MHNNNDNRIHFISSLFTTRKRIFLHLFVILFTGEGLLPGVCLLWGVLAPLWWGVSAPRGGAACSWGEVPGGDPPTATAAGGTHPTGMHSFFHYIFVKHFYVQDNNFFRSCISL